LPNHDLKPEQIRSYEAAWEQGLGDHLQFTADLFYNDMHDLITQVYDTTLGDYIFRNTDQVTARGFELELAGHWQSGLRGHISYTYTDAYQESGQAAQQWLENSPRSLGQLGLSVPVWHDKVFASLDAQAMSRRKTDAGSVPGFITFDFTLFSRELLPGLEASASIYNLLDKRFSDPVSPDFGQATVQQDGRTFQVKLTYRF
jgi:iron complex outermembrane receptor protein